MEIRGSEQSTLDSSGSARGANTNSFSGRLALTSCGRIRPFASLPATWSPRRSASRRRASSEVRPTPCSTWPRASRRCASPSSRRLSTRWPRARRRLGRGGPGADGRKGRLSGPKPRDRTGHDPARPQCPRSPTRPERARPATEDMVAVAAHGHLLSDAASGLGRHGRRARNRD